MKNEAIKDIFERTEKVEDAAKNWIIEATNFRNSHPGCLKEGKIELFNRVSTIALHADKSNAIDGIITVALMNYIMLLVNDRKDINSEQAVLLMDHYDRIQQYMSQTKKIKEEMIQEINALLKDTIDNNI